MIANAGEDIENLPLFRLGVLRALRGQQRQAKAARQLDGRLIAGFLLAVVVALQFDINILVPKDGDELFERAAACLSCRRWPAHGQWAFVAAGQADQAIGIFGEIVKRSDGLRLRTAYRRKCRRRGHAAGYLGARNLVRVMRRQRFW